jgi:hypothetical protein
MDHDLLLANIISTVKTAKAFDLPVVHSTISVATGRGRPTLPELAKLLDEDPPIDRPQRARGRTTRRPGGMPSRPDRTIAPRRRTRHVAAATERSEHLAERCERHRDVRTGRFGCGFPLRFGKLLGETSRFLGPRESPRPTRRGARPYPSTGSTASADSQVAPPFAAAPPPPPENRHAGQSADNERCRAETAQHRPPAAGPVPPGAAARTRRSHDPTDPHRRGPRRTIGLYSIRRATNASMSDVGQSSHCASSTTSSTGAVSRRLRDKVKGAASSPAVPNMTGDPPTPPSRISRAAGRRDKAGDKIRRAAS